MRARIVLLPGDGIGPEVTAAAARVLRAIAARFNHQFDLASHPIGGAALASGQPPLPRATLEAGLAADAARLGAVGDPAFDREEPSRRPERALLALRRELGAYANLRPARALPGLADAVEQAIERALGDGCRTADLVSASGTALRPVPLEPLSCSAMTQAIVDRI